MGVSKVVLGDETLIDLTSDSVSSENLLEGATAHGADGEPVVGGVVVVPMYTGTKAAIEEAITAGEIPEDAVVNITDDEETSSFQSQINEISESLGGCEFSVESDGAYITYMVGADTVTKKLGSSGNIQCFNADSVTYSTSGDYQLTFDLSSVYDDYQNLTIDNICGGFSSVSSSASAALIRSSSATFKQIDNYDSSNGIITYTITIYSQSSNRTVTVTPSFYICG